MGRHHPTTIGTDMEEENLSDTLLSMPIRFARTLRRFCHQSGAGSAEWRN
jgi:hypothetical protein